MDHPVVTVRNDAVRFRARPLDERPNYDVSVTEAHDRSIPLPHRVEGNCIVRGYDGTIHFRLAP